MSHPSDNNKLGSCAPYVTPGPRHLPPSSQSYSTGSTNQYTNQYNPSIPSLSKSSSQQGPSIACMDFSVPPPNFLPPAPVNRCVAPQNHQGAFVNRAPPPAMSSDGHRARYSRPSYSRRDSSPPRYHRREQSEEKSRNSFHAQRDRFEGRPFEQRSNNQYRQQERQRSSIERPKFREPSHRDRDKERLSETRASSYPSSSRIPEQSSASSSRRPYNARERRPSPQRGHTAPPRRDRSPQNRRRRSASPQNKRRAQTTERQPDQPLPVSHQAANDLHGETERDRLLNKWRSNYCETPDDIANKLAQLDSELETKYWIRSSPADIYYKRTTASEVEAMPRLEAMCSLFSEALVNRGIEARAKQKPYEPPPRKKKQRLCRHRCTSIHSGSSFTDFL